MKFYLENMKSKKCFRCKIEKSLDKFQEDKRKYQLPSDLSTCKVCIHCNIERALEDLSTCTFNFDENKFEVMKFENQEEVIKYFENV